MRTQTIDPTTTTMIVHGHRRPRLTLLSMCAATFLISLDLTIVNVALPSLQRQLHLTPGRLEWVVSAYALSLAALVPLGGALGDRFGRKLVFLSGMAVFAIGSVGCALSPNAASLIGARAIQGVGGAAMLALALSIITETFPAERRAAAIGVWAAIGGTGFGAGPVAGGVLLTFFGWASVFWINVPFAAIGLVATAVAVRESRDDRPRRLDLPGAVLSATGLTALAFGLIESASRAWSSPPVAAPLAAGTVLLIGFGLWERRAPRPMMPSALLRSRGFIGAAGIHLLGYLGLSGALFYVTLLYQDVDGWPALRTGLSWLFMNAPFLLTANMAGRLNRRFPVAAVVVAGCLTAAVGVLALSRATDTTPFVWSAVGYVLFGAGFGAFVPATTHLAMRDVPRAVSGAASGLLNAARQIGASIGLAVLGTLGVRTAIADWNGRSAMLPPSARTDAGAQAQNVGGARIGAVTRALGPGYRRAATDSFLHGYHVAVGLSAACLVAAALIALLTYARRVE